MMNNSNNAHVTIPDLNTPIAGSVDTFSILE